MYQNYWQLQSAPFNNDSDTRFYFPSDTHQSGLLKMRYLVENRREAGLLVGGTGLGKTYLLAKLAEQLAESHGPFVHVVFPQLSAPELLAYLALELGADPGQVGNSEGGLDRTIRELQRLFAAFSEQNRHPVLVIDEAHLIDDPAVFQALRLLLNFHQQRPDFSLILAGQRELLPHVKRYAEFEERLAVKCLLRPFNLEETVGYVTGRLEAAGTRRTIFEPTAVTTIFEVSGGIPRRINRICDLALLVGFAEESASIAADQIEAVAAELTAAVPD